MSSETSSAGYLVGYARVSTLEQDATFNGMLCRPLAASASSPKRPPASSSIDRFSMRCSTSSGPGDTVVVWRSTGSAAACATSSTPSRHLRPAASHSAA